MKRLILLGCMVASVSGCAAKPCLINQPGDEIVISSREPLLEHRKSPRSISVECHEASP